MSEPMRAEFEAWAAEEAEVRGVGETIGLLMDEHQDRYAMIWTQTAWMAWQACCKSTEATISQQTESISRLESEAVYAAAGFQAAKEKIAHQAQMIEHLRGGLATPTTVDLANADADGFKNGRKSIGLLLGKGFNTLNQVGGKYSVTLSFQNSDDAYAAYTEIATVVRLGVEP